MVKSGRNAVIYQSQVPVDEYRVCRQDDEIEEGSDERDEVNNDCNYHVDNDDNDEGNHVRDPTDFPDTGKDGTEVESISLASSPGKADDAYDGKK